MSYLLDDELHSSVCFQAYGANSTTFDIHLFPIFKNPKSPDIYDEKNSLLDVTWKDAPLSTTQLVSW
jgi:hypothetical protein